MRKGLLKKLVDHLSSHRNYFNSCLQSIYHTSTPYFNPLSDTTSLVVVNHLIDNLDEFREPTLIPRMQSTKIMGSLHPANSVNRVHPGIVENFDNDFSF